MRKQVIGYEGYYEVSDDGRVFRVASGVKPEREMKQQLNSDATNKRKSKYYRVFLTKNNIQKKYFVHRLVAIAFIQNPLGLNDVNHKDANKTNNNKENLEWCSHYENMLHAANNGLLDNLFLSRAAKKRPVIGVNKKTGMIIKFGGSFEAQKLHGFDCSAIHKCCIGKSKTHKGYVWSYSSTKQYSFNQASLF